VAHRGAGRSRSGAESVLRDRLTSGKPRRRNYGWRNREGLHDHVTTRPPADRAVGDQISSTTPRSRASNHRRYVYRGAALPVRQAVFYFFDDFGEGPRSSVSNRALGRRRREGHASDCRAHAELTASGAVWRRQASAWTPMAELYARELHAFGPRLQDRRPAAAPAFPPACASCDFFLKRAPPHQCVIEYSRVSTPEGVGRRPAKRSKYSRFRLRVRASPSRCLLWS